MSETKSEKMVRRSVAIALGIICIVLIAGFVGVFAYYVSSHHHSDSEYNDLTEEVNGEKSVVLVNQTVTLENNYTSWSIWVNKTGRILISVENYPLNFFGYFNNGYLRTVWNISFNNVLNFDETSFNTLNFDENDSVPLLPAWSLYSFSYPVVVYVNNSTNVEVTIGSPNASFAHNQTVIITYYY